ncbi:acyl carrier protein [Kitasatospora sp. NPDC052896]|uniref:acyl carrier protein n=1 Tax=Kitasatospora sp. NPDC052896 TaxID=3364061 RepID=UPI0037CC5C9A
MNPPLTYDELATLIATRAGIKITPPDLEHPNATFDGFGVDSLALLGIVGELENRWGTPITSGAESSATPHAFLAAVNTTMRDLNTTAQNGV